MKNYDVILRLKKRISGHLVLIGEAGYSDVAKRD